MKDTGLPAHMSKVSMFIHVTDHPNALQRALHFTFKACLHWNVNLYFHLVFIANVPYSILVVGRDSLHLSKFQSGFFFLLFCSIVCTDMAFKIQQTIKAI